MTIPNRLKLITKEKGLKITELAKICDIPYDTIQKHIHGDRVPGSNIVIKICSHLGVNAHWLLMGEGEMYISPSKDPQTPEEIDKIMKRLKPEQRQEILSRTLEMEKMNEMEEKLKKIEEKLEGRK